MSSQNQEPSWPLQDPEASQAEFADTARQDALQDEWDALGRFDISPTVELPVVPVSQAELGSRRRPIVFEAHDSREIFPDSIRNRDLAIAQLCTEIVPADTQVIMPHTPIATEELHDQIRSNQVGNVPTWIYGSHLPAELFARSTKVQVHPTIAGDRVPHWFDNNFPQQIESTTVPGYSAFTPHSLIEASHAMLEEFKAIRWKNPNGSSGEEQYQVSDPGEIHDILARFDYDLRSGREAGLEEYLARFGVVLEANLTDVEAWNVTVTETPTGTYSSLGRHLEPRIVLPDGSIIQEYSGTSSVVTKGDPLDIRDLPADQLYVDDPVLGRLVMPPEPRILYAAQQHINALRGWSADGIHRTRSNIDVITGQLARRDGSVEQVTASVEDSGRSGGASAGELLGIKDLQQNPGQQFAIRSTRQWFDAHGGQTYARHIAGMADGRQFWHGVDSKWDDRPVFIGVF